jgi:hypothetical protein
MKKAIVIASLAMGAILAAPVYAADAATNDPAMIALQKVKADKKYIVSQNMVLTDAEAAAFWPVYDEYQAGLYKLNERTVGVIKSYADIHNSNTMTDASAAKLLNDQLAIETDELALKKATLPKLNKALPGVKVTRYMQIENKLRAIVKAQLAEKIPLVGGDKK